MSEPTARYQYLIRQYYRKTVPEGDDNNMLSTYHLILDLKEKQGKFIGVYIAKPRHIDSKRLNPAKAIRQV